MNRSPGQEAEILLEDVRLFHGSATRGITELERAEEDTVGSGVYLATEVVAREYAYHRASHSGSPVLYEVRVERARLVDLTDQPTVEIVMGEFRTVLHDLLQREKGEDGPWYWMRMQQMIEEIDSGRGVRVGYLRAVTHRSGTEFSNYLQGKGFDGLLAVEGGEGSMSAHHSCVVFDPSKVQIISELPLDDHSAGPGPAEWLAPVADAVLRRRPARQNVPEDNSSPTITGMAQLASGEGLDL
ncbi:hypothetical protein [Nocardia sp. XZ_19_369]|uniref:hypothetical protein n=1 Tax=Nocardia sp. XZ_19_369 TaxID=2769487 RepID=UPI00188FE085|nr:hypothetical protein [Nocardia sp. XZ_19_369]